MSNQTSHQYAYDPSWCLFCHQPGHRSSNCSEDQPILIPEEDRWDMLARTTNMGLHALVGDSVTSIHKLVNLFLLRQEYITRHRSYKTRRDAIFIRIYDELANRDIPEGREYWFLRMSDWNAHIDRSLNIILQHIRAIEGGLNADKSPDESISDYLSGLPNEEGERIATQWMEGIESFVESIRENDESYRRVLASEISAPDVSCQDIMDLNPVDQVWVFKAFLLLWKLQPVFRNDPLGIVCYSSPDVDDIVRSIGFDISI